MKILVVGDSYYSSAALREALAGLSESHEVDFAQVTRDEGFQPSDDSERRLREFDGRPDQLLPAFTDHEALVVHGAPVSRAVLEASSRLRLVVCIRGGPVNVDIEAAESLGIRVATTPGKNAPAVAELTIALAVLLSRGLFSAASYLQAGNQLTSTFDGSQFFGAELTGKRLGLIGFGRVGRETCVRAQAFGMSVITYDPMVSVEGIRAAGAHPAGFDEVVAMSDVLSLHARQTPDNRHMINSAVLASMRKHAHLINTAREGLVDEAAALDALARGQLAGLGVDVFEPHGPISLAAIEGRPGLIVLPHVGGATYETLRRAADITVGSIEEFVSSSRMENARHDG
jgi:D-3-phosphoglycerate dehydrogenase / 2-oxoglutarate reductase